MKACNFAAFLWTVALAAMAVLLWRMTSPGKPPHPPSLPRTSAFPQPLGELAWLLHVIIESKRPCLAQPCVTLSRLSQHHFTHAASCDTVCAAVIGIWHGDTLMWHVAEAQTCCV